MTVLAIGNELLAGSVVDTNTAFLSRTLAPYGFSLGFGALLPDEVETIQRALAGAIEEADVVFTTGGLGPTSDDLTRHALAAAAGVGLVESPGARAKLEEFFKKRNRTLNENNLRQVIFPEGARVITNRAGTADSFCTELKRRDGSIVPVISLPGIPRETELIVREEVIPLLTQRFPQSEGAPVRTAFRCFGYSESYIGQCIESCNVPDSIEVGYRPIYPEILITMLHRGAASAEAREAELRENTARVIEAIGAEHVFTRDPDETIPARLIQLLRERKLRLAAAESCTGGLLSSMLVAQPGASDVYVGGAVTYANEAKSVLMGARPQLLEKHGAVSREIAIELARGALYRLGADIGVSVTGIAGPDGGTPEKPVGTFWIGLATPTSEEAFSYLFPTERNMFRTYAATLALDLVRRKVLGLPLTWERL